MDDEAKLRQLLLNLKNDDFEVRCYAARELGKLGDSRAVPPLIEALGGSSVVRNEAIEALGVLCDSRAVIPLIKMLKESGRPRTSFGWYGVRYSSAKALGEVGDFRAILPLLDALAETVNDETWMSVFQCITEALSKIWKSDDFTPLLNHLTNLPPKQKLALYNVEEYCKKLSKGKDTPAPLRESAKAVLAEIALRKSENALLRASEAPNHANELLRPAEGERDTTAPNTLLRASQEPETAPSEKRSWLSRLFRS